MAAERSMLIIRAVIVGSIVLVVLQLASTPALQQTAWPTPIDVTLASLNIPLALAWMGLGLVGGSCTLVSMLVLTLASALKFQVSAHHVYALSYIGTAVIVFRLRGLVVESTTAAQVRVDSIVEDTNLLVAEIEKHAAQIGALRIRFGRFASLRRVLEQLTQTLSTEKIGRHLVEAAFDVVGKSETALLFLVDEERQTLALWSSYVPEGRAGVKLKRGDAFDHWVMKLRQPLIVDDVRRDFRFSPELETARAQPVRSLIAAPLGGHRKFLGLLRLDGPVPKQYVQDDLRLLSIVSDLATVSLSNAQLYDQTMDLAMHDGLTGLYVHRYFKERLADELARCLHQNKPCSLLMLDIDDFKHYNDSYGHTAGDLVLKEIAGVLRRHLEEPAICARYGGEEFTVVLPDLNVERAAEWADALREEIASRVMRLRREETRVTVSVGVVGFPEHGTTPEELIQRVDEAMYRGKRAGKNQVCLPLP